VTNLERWRLMLKDKESPDSFINWGFHFLIASALQRRVWWGEEPAVYPNIYVFLVAEPGIGKGMVLGPVKELLAFHKLKETEKSATQIYDAFCAKLFNKTNANLSGEPHGLEGVITPDKSKQSDDSTLLFPLGANSTTYEQLVYDMARSTRIVQYNQTQPDGTSKKRFYTHNTMSFVVPELASLIKTRTENIVNFLHDTYDCVDPYEYRTKNMGKDNITKSCLNFIAGTTPHYMASAFDDKMLNEGMSARSFFIYAFSNRHFKFNVNSISEEQVRAKAELLVWLKQLSKLYGRVKFTGEAFEFIQFWYENIHPNTRGNKDAKLIY